MTCCLNLCNCFCVPTKFFWKICQDLKAFGFEILHLIFFSSFKRLPLDLTSTHSWVHSNWQNNIVFICRLRIQIINEVTVVQCTVTHNVPVHISPLLPSSGDMVQILIGTSPRNACTRNHTMWIRWIKGLQRVYIYWERTLGLCPWRNDTGVSVIH